MNENEKTVIDLMDIISKIHDQKLILNYKDTIDLAVSLQRNKIENERNNILSEAFCTGRNEPVALEAIAMALGYKKGGLTIIDAINNLVK